MELKDFDPDDPDRHLKRLYKTFAVSARIASLASKRRKTIKIITSGERLEKILKDAKDERIHRQLEFTANHHYVFEMIASLFEIDEDEVIDCALDSKENLKLIGSLFTRNGCRSILVQYQLSDAPSQESGRYDVSIRHQKIRTVLFSDGKNGEKIKGISVIVYRLSNLTDIDPKNVSDEIFFTYLPEGETVIDSIRNNLSTVYRPALEETNYSNCTEARKNDFLHSFGNFIEFFKSTHHDLQTCMVNFQVNHNLFKGFLLAPHQIKETSKKRDKVAEVEAAFNIWLKQIKSVISQGNQLASFTSECGPLSELQHWRHMLTKFNNVLEFTDSQAFQNYLKCLKLSRSKLVKTWYETENELISLTSEAKDNKKYLTSIEKFWDPLYREEPPKIIEAIPNLFQAIRSVYNQSRFYNTDLRMTGFLTKVVNQLIVASQNYLTNFYKTSIWKADIKDLIKKIEECKQLERVFRTSFSKLLRDMTEAGEKTFFVSMNYLFERYKSFERRLLKIQEVMMVEMRYEVLNRLKISGMENYYDEIKQAYQKISNKPYDPLAHRITTFDDDYITFQKEIIIIETDMSNFVKAYLDKIENVEMRILTLKRFEKLQLECLNLDRRYLDIAKMLEKEIEDIKDKYNEERANPSKEWNIPTAVARITWARCLLKKIKDPIDVISGHECVIVHPNAQLSVKYYNYLGSVLLHYEVMHHKAWFMYADQVRSKLEVPLIRLNTENNHYELNLDENILHVIKETESMMKLGLEVPETSLTLTYCKDIIFSAVNEVKKLIKRNNNLRCSIYPIFLPLMRIHLIKLERIFTPALSTLTWVSLNLTDYFKSVEEVLKPIEDFIKEISDINDAQIETNFEFIENCELIFIPENSTEPEELKYLNDQHRIKIEKIIEMKSIAAERTAVDLINKFVDISEIPIYDESGKFQLPPDKIDDTNWRVEEYKPIDRYDWLSFDKLYKPVSYASPEDNEVLCFTDYDGLKYDVNLLHIDCVELFAYYNQRMISSLVKATKKSMEILKTRANIMMLIPGTCCKDLLEKSIFKAQVELEIPIFKLKPNVRALQNYFDKLLLNIVETFYGVSTWGKHAKTNERKERKPLLDEIRHEKSWFKMISEHNEVVRYSLGFTDGILQFERKINSILSDYKIEYEYLWIENRENELENFIQKDPLLADIRDKFKHFDNITKEIKNLDHIICVQTIQIHRDKMIESLIRESEAWKNILGSKLISKYRMMLREIFDFIHVNNKKLSRKLIDFDDCTKIFTSLEEIQEKFYTFDHTIDILEEVYKIFSDFEIYVPLEEFDQIYGLRYNFNNVINLSDKVHQEAISRQEFLLKELTDNVDDFEEDILNFEDDFIEKGPSIIGISIKESSNRVMFFDIRLQELLRRKELYTFNRKVAGLPAKEYQVLLLREKQMEDMNTLYKLYWDYQKFIERYIEKRFEILDMSCIFDEFQILAKRSIDIENLPGDTKELPAYEKVRSDIDLFSQKLPLIILMSNPAIEESHWIQMEEIMGYKFESLSENFTLSIVLEAPLLDFKEELESLCRVAIKEKEDEAKDDFLFAPRK